MIEVPTTPVSDAAKSMSSTITMHALAGGIGRWAAIRLMDGGSDYVLYDTREDAIKHQLHEEYCCYVWIPPGGMNPVEAQAWLDLNRSLYDAGWHMTDPQMITPVRIEDAKKKISQLRQNKKR